MSIRISMPDELAREILTDAARRARLVAQSYGSLHPAWDFIFDVEAWVAGRPTVLSDRPEISARDSLLQQAHRWLDRTELVASIGQVYEHTVHGLFDVEQARKIIQRRGMQPKAFAFNDSIIEYLAECDLDPVRVKAVEGWMHEPAITVTIDGKALLIDGHHRLMRRLAGGLDGFWAYQFGSHWVRNLRPRGQLRGIKALKK